MRRSALEIMCCPRCHSSLSLESDGDDGSFDEGILLCSACERDYPVKDGIPHFIETKDLDGPNRRFARGYNWFSRLYPLFTKIGFLGFGGERKARKEVLDRLELNGGSLLEVSIGTGGNLPFLFETGCVGDVYGLDISAGQLARCQNLVARRGWPVDLFLGTAEALPFETASFDCVLHIGGINFFSGKKQAIDEMIRVARPGTRIVIADESEKIARNIHCLSGLFRRHRGEEIDLALPVHVLPDTMEDIRVSEIWKAHGEYHGYCLEFRKPPGPSDARRSAQRLNL
jgi:ubiquinone/menaquinone biosynthesis C-methylase UbiE/uncharacterized protein YbaR (Trm112 family)